MMLKSLAIILFAVVIISCGEDQELIQIRQEIKEAERMNAGLIKESKNNGYQLSQELQRGLEGHAILVVTYFQEGGDIDVEMTGKLIKYLDYYRENNSNYFDTDPAFQADLPLLYGIQASLFKDDRTLATENAKQSIKGFEELLEDFPDDPTLNIYYAVILGVLPKLFKTTKKAWDQHLLVDKILVDNRWEDDVPPGLRRKLYRKAIELADQFEPGSDKGHYFKAKLKKLDNPPE